MEDRAIYKKQTAGGTESKPSALKGGVIGIDFGATQLRAAMVTEHGVGRIEKRDTPNQGSADDVWQAIKELIQAVIDLNPGAMPTAICAGVPSVVDTVQGIVYDVQHIPACKELPLGRLISEEFGVLGLINNDANAFALGEYYFGAGKNISGSRSHSIRTEDSGQDLHQAPVKDYRTVTADHLNRKKSGEGFLAASGSPAASSLVGLTVGTGLGAGLILNGQLYSGPNCGAGEIGCLPYLDANLERYVSGAFFNRGGLTGKDFYQKALSGDTDALDVYREFGFHMGQAVKIAMYTYDPDRIVIGGTISQAFDLYKEEMFRTMQDFDFPGILKKVEVSPSRLQNSAILGAASLYFDHVKHLTV